MAHNAQTRAAARAAYIYDNLPLTQVSTAHGISLATLRSWKRNAAAQGDDWDKLRALTKRVDEHDKQVSALTSRSRRQ